MARWKKIIIVMVGILGALVAALFITIMVVSEPLPQGESGAEAEKMATDMLLSVNQPAFDSLQAISWGFAGRHELLWDKKRQFTRVKWDKYEVLLDIAQQKGLVWLKGKPLTRTEDRDAALNMAWRFWVNDSFWLNPVVKVNDAGTQRSVVTLPDGRKGLLVSYTSGGQHPGRFVPLAHR